MNCMSKVISFFLSAHFTHRKPSASKVARLIAQEGWKANCPKPEEIERLWKPAPTGSIEADEVIIKCVSEQTWTGLAVKDFGAKEGLGKKPFNFLCKGRKYHHLNINFSHR